MPGCCDHGDYQSVFSGRFARRTSKRYQRRGLTPAARAIADYVESRGVSGATVLEIGGGAGHLQVELLRRGASQVTNLEISQNYEAEAARILDEAGMTGRVTRRFLDIAQEPDAAVPADVVILHRVVCCYPDYAALLGAAAGHARKVLAYSHPPVNVVNRVQFGTENVYRWVTRNDFRTFLHPPEGMVRAAEPLRPPMAKLTVAPAIICALLNTSRPAPLKDAGSPDSPAWPRGPLRMPGTDRPPEPSNLL